MAHHIVRAPGGGLLLAACLAACGSSPTLTSIALAPASVTLPKGAARQMTAAGTYSDGSTRDLTAKATWSASDPTVVTVAGGLVTGKGVGISSIKAAVDKVEGVGSATVSPPTLTGLSVIPGSGNVALGGVMKLSANGTFSDGTSADVSWQATWTSATPANVLVAGNGRALAAPGAPIVGTSVITASIGSLSGTATLAVAGRAAIGPGVSNDPLLPQQWHLDNTGFNTAWADYAGTVGQDISATTTYGEGWSGAGVKVGIVDTGLEIAHGDLAANVVPGSWNFVTGTADPTSSSTGGDHGTAVAGLVAMVQGNGRGGMGVSPGAALNGYNYVASSQSLAEESKSLGGSPADPTSDDVWVFNQSYGYDNTTDFPIDPNEEALYLSGATTLRGGRGALYVKAAGNGFRAFGPSTAPASCAAAKALGTSCQNASMDPLNTLPYNLVVGAVNASGVRSSYSTAGSALWVTAPGGEYGLNQSVFPLTSCTGGCPHYAYEPAMVTTDQSGCGAGWSVNGVETGSLFDDGKVAANASCDYMATMNGTSSATPVTVGVVALLLEVNPDLGWRDVKHILATTATPVYPSNAGVTVPAGDADVAMRGYVAELPWTTNAAAPSGYRFHGWYGFGRVNVDAAVAMAKTYTSGLGTFADTGWVSSAALSLAIPDASPTGASSTIDVAVAPQALVIEAVQIAVTAIHPYSGDLGIELTSPAGTKSILLNIRNGFNGAGGGLNGMVLESNAFYGETSNGTWAIKVVDGDSTHGGGTLTGWKIRIYGH